MNLPFFYHDNQFSVGELVHPEQDNVRHIVQVLRMQTGEKLWLTNGKNERALCVIEEVMKKACTLRILEVEAIAPHPSKVTIAISLLHQASRFEWFLEKATELGVKRIIPLICSRTEKHHFRLERAKSILISAMLQSQQCRLPEISEPVKWKAFIKSEQPEKRFVAHCLEDDAKQTLTKNDSGTECILLIGPEGDFTPEEIKEAINIGYLPVSLGATRLRTETAGIAGIVLLSV